MQNRDELIARLRAFDDRALEAHLHEVPSADLAELAADGTAPARIWRAATVELRAREQRPPAPARTPYPPETPAATSLIRCSVCGNQLSPGAAACPRCGNQLRRKRPAVASPAPRPEKRTAARSATWGWMTVVVLLAVAIGWIAFLRTTTSSDSAPTAASRSAFAIVGRQGDTRFVVLPKATARDRTAYSNAIREICAEERSCTVLFWDDSLAAARSLPMTDAQMRAQVGHYERNRTTGFDRLLLLRDGRYVPDPAER